MRILIVFLILVSLVSVGSFYLASDPGYIFLKWGSWQIEMSVVLVVAAVIATIVILYIVIALLGAFISVPSRLGGFFRRKSQKRKQRSGEQAYFHLIQGEWGKAEKLLGVAIENVEEPVTSHLAAAYSSQQRGDIKGRDRHIKKAQKYGSKYRVVIGLVSARLHVENGQVDRAFEELESLRKVVANNKVVLRFLCDLYVQEGRLGDVYDLVPILQKYKVFSTTKLTSLNRQAKIHKLESADNAAELLQVWKKHENANRLDAEITAVYVRKLLEHARDQEAEKTIRRALNREWDSDLAYLYGCIGKNVAIKLLYDNAQKWYEQHSDDANLLLTLGKLAVRQNQVKEAQKFLELSVSMNGHYEAAVELGELLEQQGDTDAAFSVYKSAATGTAATEDSDVVLAGESAQAAQ